MSATCCCVLHAVWFAVLLRFASVRRDAAVTVTTCQTSSIARSVRYDGRCEARDPSGGCVSQRKKFYLVFLILFKICILRFDVSVLFASFVAANCWLASMPLSGESFLFCSRSLASGRRSCLCETLISDKGHSDEWCQTAVQRSAPFIADAAPAYLSAAAYVSLRVRKAQDNKGCRLFKQPAGQAG